MPRVYVIAGHGAGDPGACANGYSEAERVRALAARLADIGGDGVEVLDTSRNWYADGGISGLSLPAGAQMLELHMDSAGAGARGGHVVVNGNYAADEYDIALADAVGSMFPGRSQTLVGRTDLANPNRAAARGYGYRLLECCFISSAEDLGKFNSHLDGLARAILGAFGIIPGAAPAPSPAAAPPVPSAGGVSVRYRAKVGGEWLGEVVDFNNSDSEGFAGIPCKGMTAVAIGVDHGSIRYRVHAVGGSWYPWVDGYDVSDFDNGFAGDGSNYIDGVQLCYATPDGEPYQQAWYRAQTTARAGWLGVCCDDGNSVAGYDGWAGMLGEPLDRLQIAIDSSNPF